MKTTLELPDQLFRKAKATAAERGQSLKEFVTEALQDKKAGARRAATPNRSRRMFGDAMVPQSPRSLQCFPPQRKCSWVLGNME